MDNNISKVIICTFVSKRYWNDEEELQAIFNKMKNEITYISNNIRLITSEEEVNALPFGEIMVAVPMSGAVQPLVLKAAERFQAICIFPGYIRKNFCDEISSKILYLNAAPAVMDIYSVLKRKYDHVFLCLSRKSLERTLKAIKGYFKVQKSKLILIGDTEPWVISVSRDLSVYKTRLGIEIERIDSNEIVEYYNQTKNEEAYELNNTWISNATEIIEPTSDDIMNAPTNVGNEKCGYILRNHHESGIGVSIQVNFQDDLKLTACCISDEASKKTIQNCNGKKSDYEPSCRTQDRVAFDDFNKYIKNVLVCHQVLAFEDISE